MKVLLALLFIAGTAMANTPRIVLSKAPSKAVQQPQIAIFQHPITHAPIVLIRNSNSTWADWNPAGPVWVPEDPEGWAKKMRKTRRHQPAPPPTPKN